MTSAAGATASAALQHRYLSQIFAELCAIESPSLHERLVEVVELAEHPFYVASQFHPEFKSRPERPAPLFREFIAAALANGPGGRELRVQDTRAAAAESAPTGRILKDTPRAEGPEGSEAGATAGAAGPGDGAGRP